MIMESVKSLGVSLPITLVQKIDQCRGDVPRSKFILRFLEKGFEIFDNKPRPESNSAQNLKKYQESLDKITKTKNNALRKGTEINNIKKQIRIKSEIEATSNSPIPCPKREFLATDL